MSNPLTLDTPKALQKAFYAGIHLQVIAYGLNLCFYIKTMQVLLGRRKERRSHDIFYAAFSSAMFIFVTMTVAVNSIAGLKLWIVTPTHPARAIAIGFIDFVAVLSLVLQLMTTGFMIYRCQILCNSLRIIIIPLTLSLVTLVLGVLLICASPRSNLFGGIAGKLGLGYYSVVVLLNTMLTCTISYQLVTYAMLKKKLVTQGLPDPQFGLFMLTVESLLPLTLIGIAVLVSFAAKCAAWSTFSLLYALMTALSSQMLIVRVVEGGAWRKETTSSFQSASRDTSGHGGSDEAPSVIQLESLPRGSLSAQGSTHDNKV